MAGGLNNPFAATPQTVVDNAAKRFPDVAGEDQAAGYGQQQQQGMMAYQPTGMGMGMGMGYQQQQQTGYQQPQQQYQQQQPTGFQPQSAFGNHLSAQMTGYPSSSSPSYSQPSPSYAQPQQYQPTAPPITDLDPYSNLSSLSGPSSTGFGGGAGAGGGGGRGIEAERQTQSHPRQFVNENKERLMGWDDYTWAQLISSIDALLSSWEARRRSLTSPTLAGADIGAVERLKKETEEKIDGTHAAKLQLVEVKEGWRFSTDGDSKNRVRLALNAGLSSLPDYPPAIPAEQLGGSYAQRGWEESRKQGIMSGYTSSQPMGYQQTGAGAMGYQQTGFQPQQQQLPQQQMAYQQTGYQQPQMQGQMGYQQSPMGYQQTGMYPQAGQGGYY